MSDIEGGRAFPSSNDVTVGEFVTHGHTGMTLRDWFAGQALTVLGNSELFKAEEPSDQTIAKAAYELADAMLHARMVDR